MEEPYYLSNEPENLTYLEHHGILGQKWGIRRYQNPDGSLTSAGKKRYLADGDKNKNGRQEKKPSKKLKINPKVVGGAALAATLATPIALAGTFVAARKGYLGVEAMKSSLYWRFKVEDLGMKLNLFSWEDLYGIKWSETHYDVLIHHGIKGMKWGIRRYQNPDGSLTSAGKKRYGSDSKTNDLSSLSDDEMRSYINRRNLEKQYRTAKNEEQVAKNAASTKKKVKDMTNQEIQDYLNRRRLESDYKKATNPAYAVRKTLTVVGGVVLTARLNKKMNAILDLGESKIKELINDSDLDLILIDILDKIHGP